MISAFGGGPCLLETGKSVIGGAEALEDGVLFRRDLGIEACGTRAAGCLLHSLAEGVPRGGLEAGVVKGRAGGHLGVHGFNQEFREEVGLADAIDVKAELKKFAGDGAQALVAELFPVAFEGESIFHRIGRVADPIVFFAGALAGVVEPSAEGVAEEQTSLKRQFRGRRVLLFVGRKQSEDLAGVGRGCVAIASDLERMAAAVEEGAAEGEQLGWILRFGDQRNGIVKAAARFGGVLGDEAAVRGGEGESLEIGGIALIREFAELADGRVEGVACVLLATFAAVEHVAAVEEGGGEPPALGFVVEGEFVSQGNGGVEVFERRRQEVALSAGEAADTALELEVGEFEFPARRAVVEVLGIRECRVVER